MPVLTATRRALEIFWKTAALRQSHAAQRSKTFSSGVVSFAVNLELVDPFVQGDGWQPA